MVRAQSCPIIRARHSAGSIAGGENLVHTVDLTATEAYQRGDPSRRALVDLGGARSHLIAALRKDGALLGTIAVYRHRQASSAARARISCLIGDSLFSFYSVFTSG